ncbi:MAG: hypothetical protein Q7S65_01170 [Nanoarchaeota archaeon]|nr:hypothetical protein [Nanoarchaeota archaeon]
MAFKSLVAGGVVGAALGYALFSPSPESSVGPALTYLKSNPSASAQYSSDILALAQQGFSTHPEQANSLLRSGLSSVPLEPSTYLLLFQKTREKAEEKPELMQHFGPRALQYLEHATPERKSSGLLETVLKLLEGD